MAFGNGHSYHSREQVRAGGASCGNVDIEWQCQIDIGIVDVARRHSVRGITRLLEFMPRLFPKERVLIGRGGIVVNSPPNIISIIHAFRFIGEIHRHLVDVVVLFFARYTWREYFIEGEGVLA